MLYNSDMPLRRLRTRNSTKVVEERGDAVPWPLPTESTPLPGSSTTGKENVQQFAGSASNPILQGNHHRTPNNGPGVATIGTPPFLLGGGGPLPPPGYNSFQDEFRRMGVSMSAFPNTPILHGGHSELMGHALISPSYLPMSPQTTPGKRFSCVPPVGVFWDIENCQVPRGKSALIAVQRIREKFFSRFLEADFVCVCDIRKESPLIIQELNDAQVSVVHVAGNSKNAADDKLRQAMRRFADVYTSIMPLDAPPATIILISGDINFATDLSDLRYRKRLYVILLHNRHAPEALLLWANEHYDFHTLLGDLPNRIITREDFDEEKDIPMKGGMCPMDVVVTDLPLVKNVNKVKMRLKKLSDNCGGKVVTVQGQFAVVRFPNKEAAVRATKRMTGEDVFGSKIRALYSSQIAIPTLELEQAAQAPKQAKDEAKPSSSKVPTAVAVPFVMKYENLWDNPTEEQVSDDSDLKKQVVALLKEVPNNSLPLFKFKEMFERRYGRIVTDYDLYRLRDVVSISESSGYSSSSGSDSSTSSASRIISLCRDLITVVEKVKKKELVEESSYELTVPMIAISLRTFSARIQFLLRSQGGKLPMTSFVDRYETSYGPLEGSTTEHAVPLEHLISCVPGVEVATAEDGSKFVQAKAAEEGISHFGGSQSEAVQMTQLSRELVDLLTTFPKCCLPYSKLIPAYHKRFGRHFKPTDYNFPSLWSLVKTLPDTIQIIGEDLHRVLTLSHKAQMKRFLTDVLRVLKAQASKQVRVEDFPTAFSQVFPSRTFRPQDYGLCDLSDLIHELLATSNLVTLFEDEEGASVLSIPVLASRPQSSASADVVVRTAYELSTKLRITS